MKKMFTKLIGSTLLLTVVAGGFRAQAQNTGVALASIADTKHVAKTDSAGTATTNQTAKKADDAAWVPVRRLWGYAFGDMYYNTHADATNRGSESMYNGVPSNRNSFQFRRIYLGYDYDISRRFTAEVLLASEPNANTGVNGSTNVQNGDNLVDNKMSFFIKNFNLRYRDLWKGTDLVVGELSTPGFALNEPGTNGPISLSESTWGYRFIEKTITDVHKNNSYDVGAALQGTFDPSTKNFGYVFMVGNNTTASLLSASNPNTGFYKIFYGTVWGKFFNKQLYVDFYSDYAPTAASTPTIGFQSHSMHKIFAAYLNPKLSVGLEAYTQQITNGVTNTVTKSAENATVNGLTVWVKGAIIKDKLGFFARYDSYNPNTNFNADDSYSVDTNYGAYNPTNKETFYTAGLDFTPEPKIHFSPNLWLINYKDQRSSTTTGYVGNDHNLVLRMTFFYTFGK